MPIQSSDRTLFETLRNRLFTAVVGDVLDALGYRHQFLPQGIGPLRSADTVVGRAMPVLEADVFRHEPGRGPLSGRPFGLMLEALDDLRAGEVYVGAGASPSYALWGELMSTRAIHLGAAGAVLNGPVRDAAAIEELGFPTFCRGLYAQDQGQRGQVVDYRCTVEIAGVRVDPGMLIFGDREGVLVIPREAEEETVRLALEKVSTESAVATAIRGGMSAVEAFEKFGVM